MKPAALAAVLNEHDEAKAELAKANRRLELARAALRTMPEWIPQDPAHGPGVVCETCLRCIYPGEERKHAPDCARRAWLDAEAADAEPAS